MVTAVKEKVFLLYKSTLPILFFFWVVTPYGLVCVCVCVRIYIL
jgi:hypothetical protein